MGTPPRALGPLELSYAPDDATCKEKVKPRIGVVKVRPGLSGDRLACSFSKPSARQACFLRGDGFLSFQGREDASVFYISKSTSSLPQ